MTRTVAWFSCGAASAVATKLAIADDPDTVVAYTDPGSEDADNRRFLHDCEEWFGREVLILRSTEYVDTWDVWRRRKFIIGPHGAPCTLELKKRLRQQFEQPDDRQVFGYHYAERHRVDGFVKANPDVNLWTPLIEAGLSKTDCLAIVDRAGLTLPLRYRLGYDNANCIGCPHGGFGYWNRERRHYPEAFAEMAKLERELDHAVNKDADGPVFLDELDPDRGDFDSEPSWECSLLCVPVEVTIGEKP